MRLPMLTLLAAITFQVDAQTCRVIIDEDATIEESYFDCFGSTNAHITVILDSRSDPAKFRLLDDDFEVLDEEFDGNELVSDFREGTYYIEARLDSMEANCSFINRNVRRDTIRYLHEEVSPGTLTEDHIELTQISDCGAADGVITVQDWPGIEYRVSEVSPIWRSSGIFKNLAGGSYRVRVRDRRTRCESNSVTVQILEPSPTLDEDDITTVEPTACGRNDGAITFDLPNGVEINFAERGWSTQNSYENLGAGSYTYTLRNPLIPECVSNAEEVILEGVAAPMLSLNQVEVSHETVCMASDGAITISHSLDGLEYGINGNFSATATFSRLSPAIYEVQVRSFDDPQCESNVIEVEIEAAEAPTLSASMLTISEESQCGAADGSIAIDDLGDGIEYGLAGVYSANSIFSGLSPGIYMVAVRSIADPSCASTPLEVEVKASGAPVLNAGDISIIDEQNCAGSDGSITVNSTLSGIEYGLNGSFASSNSFANLAPGFYDVQIRVADEATCVSEAITIFVDSVAKPAIAASDFQVSDVSDCGATNGSITVENVDAGLEYSIDGDVYTTDAEFANLAAGRYEVQARYIGNNQCLSNIVALDIIEPGAPILNANNIVASDPTECGIADGSIELIGFNSNFQSSIDGGANFSNSLIYSDLSAGDYLVVVQDANGCQSATIEVALIDANAPVLTVDDFFILGESSCGNFDGSVSINDTDFEFQIVGVSDFGADVFDLAAGSYELEYRRIDAPDCSNFLAIQVGFTEGDIVLKFPGSLNMLVYPDSTLDYVWGTMNNGNFTELPAEKNDRQFYILENSYNSNLTYAVMLFCGDQSETVLFDGPVQPSVAIHVFPNPAPDILYVNWPGSGQYTYRIMDNLGKTQVQGQVSTHGQLLEISLESLPAGSHHLLLQDMEFGFRHNVTFIKSK